MSDGEITQHRQARRYAVRNIKRTRNGLPEFRPIGMENFHFTSCFAISMLQAIIAHPRFSNFIRYEHMPRRGAGPRLHAHKWRPEDDVELHCGVCELYELSVRYWSRSLETPKERARQVNSRVEKLLRRFRSWCAFIGRNDFVSEVLQQDAPEFYDLLYDWMADSLHNTLEIEEADAQEKALCQLLWLDVRVEITCKNCQDVTRKFEPRLYTSANMPYNENTRSLPAYSLEDLLEKSLGEEEVEARCDECKLSERLKKDIIVAQPDLLCVRVSRFNKYSQKIYNELEFRELLELKEYMYPDVTSGAVYRLIAVVKHRGPDTRAGHYITWTRINDRWQMINDQTVRPSNLEGALIPSGGVGERGFYPYILFYELLYEKGSTLPPSPTDRENPEKAALTNQQQQQKLAKSNSQQPEQAQEGTAQAQKTGSTSNTKAQSSKRKRTESEDNAEREAEYLTKKMSKIGRAWVRMNSPEKIAKGKAKEYDNIDLKQHDLSSVPIPEEVLAQLTSKDDAHKKKQKTCGLLSSSSDSEPGDAAWAVSKDDTDKKKLKTYGKKPR